MIELGKADGRAPGDVEGAVLRVEGLHVGFPDARGGHRDVVHGIDLEVRAGRVTALVGESGSGKSVSALSVLRLLAPQVRVTGAVRFGPDDLLTVGDARLREVRGTGIGMVFQEPMGAWNPVQTVGAQIAEAIGAHEPHEPGVPERVRAALARVGLDDPERVARAFPHQLSGGQLQRAMIAMATVCDPAVVIADEPTTALDVTVQAGVLDVFRGLVAAGTGLLLITHDMGVVADLADDVVVLHDGRVVERGGAEQVLTAPREDYTRTLLAAVPTVRAVRDTGRGAPSGVAARLRGARVTFRGRRGGADLHAVDGVDLDVPSGRTVGLVGESGSGKSTVGRLLAGLVEPSAGTVEVGGTELAGLRARRLRGVRREVGIVFQDPGSSLNPKQRVGWSVAEPLRLAGWDAARAGQRVDEVLAQVGLDPGHAARYPFQLSGGQRQRVAIARAIALRPRLLVADEPTSALDVSVQARVLDLLRSLQDELGFGCLFITHDLAVVAAVAHEVAVMRRGVLVEQGPAARVLTDPAHGYTRDLLAAAPVIDPVEQRRRREARLALTATREHRERDRVVGGGH